MMSQIHGLKGTWRQAFFSFLFPLLGILIVRWAVLEPYVIPSGSMLPNLLVHDHIVVLKSSLGLRLPFTDTWIVRWSEPQRGDVLVFRYPQNPSMFFIKRLIGQPGDRLKYQQGEFRINDELISLSESPAPSSVPAEESADFEYFIEDLHTKKHLVRFFKKEVSEGTRQASFEVTVPEGKYFFMGDNRDQSSDSRVWGFVDETQLIGKAWAIWLSCDEMLESAKFICDPTTLRWKRILKSVD